MAAALVQRLGCPHDPNVANWVEQLLFTADALPIADACLAYPPDLIGVFGSGRSGRLGDGY